MPFIQSIKQDIENLINDENKIPFEVHRYCAKKLEQVKDIIEKYEKEEENIDKGEISDGYHTFNELYLYRMLYNAAFFNLLPKNIVHKSKKHHTGEECFGGGWFIVMAELPTGQISNHYELKYWDLFDIPEKEYADEWDGHSPQEAANRLQKFLEEKHIVVSNKVSKNEQLDKMLDVLKQSKNIEIEVNYK